MEVRISLTQDGRMYLCEEECCHKNRTPALVDFCILQAARCILFRRFRLTEPARRFDILIRRVIFVPVTPFASLPCACATNYEIFAWKLVYLWWSCESNTAVFDFCMFRKSTLYIKLMICSPSSIVFFKCLSSFWFAIYTLCYTRYICFQYHYFYIT